jgi:hypothetical protein
VPQLPAPAPSVPQRPEPPDFAGMPPAVRAQESAKYYSQLSAQPVQEAQAEVVPEPGMAEHSARVNRHATNVGSVGDRLRESFAQNQQYESPRGIVVAARPSPPPQVGHGGWDGAVEPLNG